MEHLKSGRSIPIAGGQSVMHGIHLLEISAQEILLHCPDLVLREGSRRFASADRARFPEMPVRPEHSDEWKHKPRQRRLEP